MDLARWLIDPATRGLSVEAGLTALIARLDARGLALSRVRLSIPTLHPEIYVRRLTWTRERGAELFYPTHALVNTPEYLDSPVAIIHAGGDAIRCKLVGPDADLRWQICRELASQGCTEYACLPLVLGDGQRTFLSITTDREGGFVDAAYAEVIALLPDIAAWLDLKAAQLASRGLLEVYLGKKAAARVLAGEVRRGTGAATHAAIWTCDLRGFTALSDARPAADVVATLDRYFEAVAVPIDDHGGEVLKFIGDAVLAIFPVDGSRADACRRALLAATEALDAMAARVPELGLGVALHVGEVLFGNIGARQRLDFTVIGAAVNEACRMESMCKTLGAPLIVSAPFAAALDGAGLVSLGAHALRGVTQPQELFTIARYAPAPATTTYRHPTGAELTLPAGWQVTESPQVGVQLVPPDAAQTPQGPAELYLVSAQPAPGLSRVDDPNVVAYVDQSLRQLIPMLSPPSAPSPCGPGIALRWTARNPQTGAPILAIALLQLAHGAVAGIIALGEQARVEARRPALETIFASLRKGEGARDPALVGVWHHWAYKASGPVSSETRKTMQLAPDGTVVERSGHEGIGNFTGKDGYGNTAWTAGYGSQSSDGRTGTWTAGDGMIYIQWQDGSGQRWQYQLSGAPGARRLMVQAPGAREAMEWNERPVVV